MKPILEMEAVTKEFPGVKALENVNLDLLAGEFHALVGENGAGKSTLMKVLSGVYPHGDFSGKITIEGHPREFENIGDAEKAGIAIIFQELSLVKELTVAENIFLGREPNRFGIVNWREIYQRSTTLLKELNLDINAQIEVGKLGIAQQQLVEIAKALSQDAKILVLDEPTAALTESEVKALFKILSRLKERGVGMIYISHKLDEVFEMGDRITVLRDGKTVETRDCKNLSKDEVIAAMVGREVGDIFPPVSNRIGDIVLEVDDFDVYDPIQKGKKLVDRFSMKVRKGEVLGISGLMGAGRSELLMGLFGAWIGEVNGSIRVNGEERKLGEPKDAIDAGIGFVTEDRKRYGLILDESINDNSTIACLRKISGRFFTHRSREIKATRGVMDSLRIKAPSPLSIAGTLSGGNQQKVVLGKWLLTNPLVLFLDEPTRGIDVGAKQEIYTEINRLAEEGMAIVLVSSELPEILGLSNRILTIFEGKKMAEFSREDATPERIMAAATGSN